MRNKIISLAIVLALVITIIIPWVNGFLFKKNFFHAVVVINQDKRLAIEVLAYHQGWFTSHAKIRITLLNRDVSQLQQLRLTSPSNFILEESIHHGPILYSSQKPYFELGFARLHTDFISNLKNADLLQVDAISGFNGDWHGNFFIPKMSISVPRINKFLIEKSKGNFAIILSKHNIEHVLLNLETGRIIIEGDAQNTLFKKINIQPIKGTYDALREDSGLWSGNSGLHTSEMKITRADNTDFNISQLGINSTFSVDKNIFYNTNLSILMQNISSPSGIIPSFSKLEITLLAQNFSVQGLNNYIHFVKSKTPEEIKNIDIKMIDNLLAHTITPTSILQGSISSDTSLGSFSSNSQTIWPNNTVPPHSTKDIINHSFTTINVAMSESLITKLLKIYSNDIMAIPADMQKAQFKKAVESKKYEYFKNYSSANESGFHQTIDQLLKEKKITFELSLQILSLEKQNQSLKAFSINIDQLNLPSDISDKLKLSYQQQKANAKVDILDARTKQLLKELISISYLKKDDKGYTSTVTIEKGTLIINGSPLLSQQSKTFVPEQNQIKALVYNGE